MMLFTVMPCFAIHGVILKLGYELPQKTREMNISRHYGKLSKVFEFELNIGYINVTIDVKIIS